MGVMKKILMFCCNPENGYKLTVVILAALFVYSCGTRKKDISYNPVTSPPPIVEQQKDSVQDGFSGGGEFKTDSLSILIMMPFKLKENFTIDTSGVFYDINAASLPAVHFYEGALLAVMDLKKKGITVTIEAIQSPADSVHLMRIENSAMWKKADFVIAKVLPSVIEVLARRAKVTNKQLILTQATDSEILLHNKQILISHASTLTQCRSMSEFITNKFSDSQITVVYRKTNREDYLASVFLKAMKANNPTQRIVDFNATTASVDKMLSKLSITKNNLVLVVSSDEAFVSPIISKLQGYESEEVINVAGLPTWQDFESINFMQFDSLAFYLFENNYINHKDRSVKNIQKKFVRMFSTYPGSGGYNGYSIVYELGLSVHEAGVAEVATLANFGFVNDSVYYHFTQPDSLSGFENESISVLRLIDYELVKVH
jgi:hypothetical protein